MRDYFCRGFMTRSTSAARQEMPQAENIHQRPLAEAVRLCNAIYAITVENAGVDEAYKIYQGD